MPKMRGNKEKRLRLVSRRKRRAGAGGKRPVPRLRGKWLIPLVLIGVGLILVVIAGVMEAGHYPWPVLFGHAGRSADSIPDPSPIELDTEDRGSGVILVAEQPSASSSSLPETPPVDTPEVSSVAAVPEASAETPASSPTAAASPAAGVIPGAGTVLPGDENAVKTAPAMTTYVVLGTLKIPVLNVSQNLLEGSGKQMKYGVGHVTSTSKPGQQGNCAIAGHRPYPFRYLDKLAAGDTIVVKAGERTYTYTVYDIFSVLPAEIWVLDPVPGEDSTLTLITCTPYMVSSHRLIVRARLTDVNGTPFKAPASASEATPTEVLTDMPNATAETSSDIVPESPASP